MNRPIHRALLFIPLLSIALAIPSLANPPDATAYRSHSLRSEGNATHGEKLFNSTALACYLCHSVDGSASKAGPDLFAAGDAFGRRELINSVLEPSATIAPGYGTTIIETNDGTSYQGVLKGSTAKERQLMGADGKLITIPTADIKSQSGTAISLMPEGLHTQLSPSEFNDLIEYLTSLKQEESSLAIHHGMPSEITEIPNPIKIEPFFENDFTLPRSEQETGLTSFRQIPGSGNEYLVLHQQGIIWKITKSADSETKAIFSDLTDKVFSARGPNGLLDVCFHPNFRENRKYYLFYQVFEDDCVTSLIVEKEFSQDFSADSGKEPNELLRILSVAEDHSGGCLQFGPDGFLYIVMGDTGPHNDPNGHAQDMNLLLGKMLRIDVNKQEDGKAYAIPPSNPFIHQAATRPEIWAYGLRNPWRFSFDRLTQDLWLADVGQDRVEEVSIIRSGENHGWNIYEGYEPFSNQYRKKGEEYTMPVFAYRRKYGNSVTGGHVYRAKPDSSFYGIYVCGDFTSKIIFGLVAEDGILKTARQIGKLPQRLVSFSEDETGELFAVGYEGKIYSLDFSNSTFK